MKNIIEIKKEQSIKIDQLFEEVGLFWAFSNEQFAANKTPLADGDKYVSIGAGGYLPKSKMDVFKSGMSSINRWYKETVKANKSRRSLIEYELGNYECYYTNDITEALEALGPDYTEAEVMEVFNDVIAKSLMM